MSFHHLSFSHLLVAGLPGVWSWDEVNPGTAALLDVVELGAADRVLDLGCGTGVIGAAAAQSVHQGHVTLVDCNAAAVACAQETLRLNRIANAEARLGDGCAGLEPSSFERVLCHLPRERAVQEELLRGAAAVLAPGGTLTFVAHRQAGVRTAVDMARDLFGRCGVIRQKKGYHVAMALRPPDRAYALPGPGYAMHTVTVDGVETKVVGKPGVFAWDRLDDGTAALIAAMAVGPTERVLDIGCGTGLAGLAAARRAPHGHVVLSDVDVRAVEAARRTVSANGVVNAEVQLSDGGAGLPDRSFDTVIANPPFHQGVSVERTAARRFIQAAARLLVPTGRLFLVANAFLPYEPWLAESFREVTVVWDDKRYRVWEGGRRG
ncbi:MAG: methyltransferase [Anaerolineae bacterium]|nr:methyltransferase [Anaerolineae bacterium]